jgi:hypothetical protein
MLVSMDFCRIRCILSNPLSNGSWPMHCPPRLLVTVRVGFSLLTLVGRDRWCSFLCPLLVRPYLADPF